MINIKCWPILVLSGLYLMCNNSIAQTCHYQDWRWNVIQKQVVQSISVTKDYATLTADERDPQSGCSVCTEDQQLIKIQGVPEFSMCKHYAHQVKNILSQLMQNNAKINSITGYRVGRTRGEIDAQGNRTGFSNHSYGVAIDINAEHNGLYINCVHFGPQCQLSRGGPWSPETNSYSLKPDSAIVMLFKQAGFKWGGEIKGQQKDFMHFSLSGY